MSSFDRAFNQASANQRRQDAAEGQTADRHRQRAEAAVPVVNQLIRDFLQRMAQYGVPPRQVHLYDSFKRGLFSNTKPHYSPAGYVLSEQRAHVSVNPSLYPDGLSLLTPEGRLFRYSSYRQTEEYVPITADTLMTRQVALAGRTVLIDDDGELYANIYEGDDERRETIVEALAKRAAQLVHENAQRR